MVATPARIRSSMHWGAGVTYEEYHPYGTTAWWAEKSGIQVSRKRYRYTGMERDEETGLGYHSARYYAPWLGRWERPDPAGLVDGVNRYAYTRGNPVKGRDPSGFRDENPPGLPPRSGPFENKSLTATDKRVLDPVVVAKDNLSEKDKRTLSAYASHGLTYPFSVSVEARLKPETTKRYSVGNTTLTRVEFDVEIIVEGQVRILYGDDPSVPQDYGVGSTLGEHEEAHLRNFIDFQDPENIKKLLAGELVLTDPVTGTQWAVPGIDIPTYVSVRGDDDDAKAKVTEIITEIQDYVDAVVDFQDKMMVHAPQGPGEWRGAIASRLVHIPTGPQNKETPGELKDLYRLAVEEFPRVDSDALNPAKQKGSE